MRTLGLILLILLPLPARAAPFALYPAGNPIEIASTPFDLKAADIGGAGADLFVADLPANSIRWLRNDGYGNFPTSVFLPESQPVSIELADVNNDGRLDLVSGNWGDSQVSVRLNSGADPPYDSAALKFAMGARNVRDLVVVDLDGDGLKDLAAINSDGRCYLRKGNGDGTFGPSKFISGGTTPKAIASADLGGDGRPDLVLVDFGQNRLRIHRNMGGLNFAIAVPVTTGEHPTDVVTRDLDGDGDIDLAVSDELGSVTVLVNDGTGAFGTKRTIAVGAGTQTLLAVDLDGDGDDDLAVPAHSNQTLQLFLNSGAGEFTPAEGAWISRGTRGVATLDRNGDGRADLVTANEDDYTDRQSLTFFDNLTAPPASIPACGLAILPTAPGPSHVIVPDLDGDGEPDLATANASGSVSYWLRQPGGTFGPRVDLPAGSVVSVAAGDLNLDGRADLVAASPDEDAVTVWRNAGSGSFVPVARLPVGAHPRFVRLADLDGDGRLDIATANHADGTVTILFNPPGADWAPVAEPVFGADTPPAEITAVAAGGAPLGSSNRRVDLDVGPSPTMLEVGDTNLDGIADLIVANDAGAPIGFIPGLGQGRFSPLRRLEITGTSLFLYRQDYEGAPQDLLVADGGASCIREVRDFRGDGFYWFQLDNLTVDPHPTSIVKADVNSDGYEDLVWLTRDGLFGTAPYGLAEFYLWNSTCAIGDDAPSLAVAHTADRGAEVFAVSRGANEVTRARYEPYALRAFPRTATSGGPAGLTLGLERPFPNPTAAGSTIAFTLPAKARVRIGVFDVRGRLVKVLGDGDWDAGRHVLAWDGTTGAGDRAAPGIYFYRLDSTLGSRGERQMLVGP